ncbi:S8 family serine peptidase [Halopiger goleimassiliensis]|uniref:S8 family serine peptidase n=1 Tax=Halopiger goleimassiliensis TaxID=1293048 RepID=UPI0006780438|nr:S8 family serine peptidase [Halopiger goleimassiliensis]
MVGSWPPRHRVLVCLVCVLLVAATAPLPAASGPPLDDDSEPVDVDVDDETLEAEETLSVVVRLEDAPVDDRSASEAERLLEAHAEETQAPLLEYASSTAGIDVLETFWVTNAVLLEIETDRVDLGTFERFDAVERIHENVAYDRPEPPKANATAVSEPDGTAAADRYRTTRTVASIGAPSVWEAYETRGEGTRVAVLDTGVAVDHPDIDLYTDDPSDPTYPGGWAEFDEHGDRVEGSTPHDTGRHGTHVSGTVAGGATTGTTVGVAPDAELLHGLVLDEEGGTFAQIVAGIEWAIAAEADVINLSLGTTGTHAALIDPVRNARETGALVVAAIGNEGVDTSGSPGNVYESTSVGAVTVDGEVAPFSGGEPIARSDWNGAPDEWPETYVVPTVTAPGVEVVSTVPGGYARLPGTSMAAPHVAGTAALLRSIAPEATGDEVERTIVETAWKPEGESLEQDHRYGYGIVDAVAAADALIAEQERLARQSEGERASNETLAGGDVRTQGDDHDDPIRSLGLLGVGAVVVGLLVSLALVARYREGVLER